MEQTVEQLSEYVDVKHPTFAYMIKNFGAGLERLTKEQKMFIIYNALDDLAGFWGDEDFPDEIYRTVNNMCVEITEESDAIALIKFLAQSL